MTRVPRLALALTLATVAAGSARAGGLARPNQISARGVGLGGAFTGIADDPTAWYFNPAGAAWADDAFSIGGEMIFAPRSYVPVAADGTRGAAQKTSALAPAPAFGVIFHPTREGVPSRLAFGAGLWNSFGGQLQYKDKLADGVPAVNSSSDLLIELALGAAYEVDDVLAIGGAVRMGLGVFAVDASAHPVDTNISNVGIGIGATLGAMVRPIPALQLGLTWRSGMNVATTGSGTANLSTPMQPVDAKSTQNWPQQAALGVAVRATSDLRLAAELDWTQWSTFETITIDLSSNVGGGASQTLPLDWRNTWTARGGAELRVGSGAIRAGGYYDTYAVPDRTIERQYLDDNKIGVSGGGTVVFGDWHVDGALDVTLPGTRKVADNKDSLEVPGGISYPYANIAPGEHSGYVVTLELALARRL